MKKRLENRKMFYGANAYLFSKAEELRCNLTVAETFLWEEINNNKLEVRFKCQHPINRWIVDFYCHKHKLAIEIDGGYHDNKLQKEKDLGRSAEIEKFGIKILRFRNDIVINDIKSVIESIKGEILIDDQTQFDGPCDGSHQ